MRYIAACLAALLLTGAADAAPRRGFDVSFKLFRNGDPSPLAAGATGLEKGVARFAFHENAGAPKQGYDGEVVPHVRGDGKVYLDYRFDYVDRSGFEAKAHRAAVADRTESGDWRHVYRFTKNGRAFVLEIDVKDRSLHR